MSAWFSLSLGDALVASEPMGRIEALCESAHANTERPEDMAVFVRYESEGRLHCEVTAYFPPVAAEVARQLDARPCARPSPNGLSLLVGADGVWSKHFPERGA